MVSNVTLVCCQIKLYAIETFCKSVLLIVFTPFLFMIPSPLLPSSCVHTQLYITITQRGGEGVGGGGVEVVEPRSWGGGALPL